MSNEEGCLSTVITHISSPSLMLLDDHLIVIIVTYHRSVKGGCLNNPTQSFPRQPQNNPTQGSFFKESVTAPDKLSAYLPDGYIFMHF